MNTEQQAAQLELAAQILRTGHPWEYRCKDWYSGNCILTTLKAGYKIRPILATPPDGRKLHNPLGLTAEQVGVGYRLTLEEEMDGKRHDACEWFNDAWLKHDDGWYWKKDSTIRVPLSTPWPEAKPDPYAELKKAHAEGNVIQVQVHNTWQDTKDPNLRWSMPPEYYRIKPWTMPEPPAGNQWHRPEALTQAEWEAGWRPGCLGERMQTTDEFFHFREGWVRHNSIQTLETTHLPFRTKRPLPIDKELVWVPLEAQDVPPGSAIQRCDDESWSLIVVCMDGCIEAAQSDGHFNITFSELFHDKWKILRPGQTEWQLCRKEAK